MTALSAAVSSPARQGAMGMGPEVRQELAIQALAQSAPRTALAEQADVSRKFVTAQANKARQALQDAFQPRAATDEQEVLFWLPVTRQTLQIVVVVLLLRCHSSYRGVVEFMRDVFDYSISLGTVHNIAQESIQKVRVIHRTEELSGIHTGAHDEIFQGDPVLVGVDPSSTYCYLLASEPHRDETTWGVHLLDLSASGLKLDQVIADAGTGLRAGQKLAWPKVPCWGDVFHVFYAVNEDLLFHDRSAFRAISTREKVEEKLRHASGPQRRKLKAQLALALADEAIFIKLSDDVHVLADWLHNDILCFAGPSAPVRRELFDFVVVELRARQHLAPHRLGPLCTALENQRDDLLAFVDALDLRLQNIAQDHRVSIDLVRRAFDLQRHDASRARYWQLEAEVWASLGTQYLKIKEKLLALKDQVVRASSMAENLNSRLRGYFFLRREVGAGYLELLRFSFNHHRFDRSRREERVGKSPAEILMGKKLPHWLEQLGFTLFRRPASP